MQLEGSQEGRVWILGQEVQDALDERNDTGWIGRPIVDRGTSAGIASSPERMNAPPAEPESLLSQRRIQAFAWPV